MSNPQHSHIQSDTSPPSGALKLLPLRISKLPKRKRKKKKEKAHFPMLPTAQSDGSWTGEKSWQSSEKELGAYEQCDVLENIELQSFQ